MNYDMATIAGFSESNVVTSSGEVFARVGGSGPPVLLLHGFPETGLMWHAVAPQLAGRFTTIVADLPGYGLSACPADSDDHAPMSKRSLANTLVAAMRELGHEWFAVVGHDRGGRVAYRAALYHPEVVTKVAVLDIVPTAEVWDRADGRLALSFWPFSLLAQPAPLPERLVAGDPSAVVDNALSHWGSPAGAFPAWIRDHYIAALREPAHVHAICEEYRAAAGLDREHDRADFAEGRKIRCPLLALWSAHGGPANWYEDAGGPLALWRRWATDVAGGPVPGGHFFPEEQPVLTAELIADFLAA
jgi:haloacetate dehalogenase